MGDSSAEDSFESDQFSDEDDEVYRDDYYGARDKHQDHELEKLEQEHRDSFNDELMPMEDYTGKASRYFNTMFHLAFLTIIVIFALSIVYIKCEYLISS